jgi:GntR family transcriptional regulator
MAAPSAIDRESYEPPYLQLARGIRERIAAGEFRPGDRLPSESELCDAYAVSPMTVRRAVDQLLREGVVTTAQGRGTFVKPLELMRASFGLEALRGILDSPDVVSRILSASIVQPTTDEAARLAVDIDRPVVQIRRLLSRGEEPLLYHSEVLVFDPRRPLVEGELGVMSLRDLFAGRSSEDLKFGTVDVIAGAMGPQDAAALGEREGTVAWVLEHLFFDFDDRPTSWGRFVARADRIRLSTTVGLVGGPGRGR